MNAEIQSASTRAGLYALGKRKTRAAASDNVQLLVQLELRGQQKWSALRIPLWNAIEPGFVLHRNCLPSNVDTESGPSVSFMCRGDVSVAAISPGFPSAKCGVSELFRKGGGRSPNKSLNRTRYSGLFLRGWRIVTTEKATVTARLTRR